MKKVLLALFAVLTLAACTGSYKSGNCEYDFLLHKDISISNLNENLSIERLTYTLNISKNKLYEEWNKNIGNGTL